MKDAITVKHSAIYNSQLLLAPQNLDMPASQRGHRACKQCFGFRDLMLLHRSLKSADLLPGRVAGVHMGHIHWYALVSQRFWNSSACSSVCAADMSTALFMGMSSHGTAHADCMPNCVSAPCDSLACLLRSASSTSSHQGPMPLYRCHSALTSSPKTPKYNTISSTG